MNIKILAEGANPLLNRKELVAEIAHPGKATPLRKEIISELAKSMKEKEEVIIVDKILTRKGSSSCEAKVLVYSRKEDIPKHSLEKQERRLGLAKKPEGASHESKAEAPKEQKKPEKEEKAEKSR